MKWLWVILLVIAGALAFFFREPLQTHGSRLIAQYWPSSAHEKEVREVFANYTNLFTHGDPRSERLYMQNTVFRVSGTNREGRYIERDVTEDIHRIRVGQFLAQVRAGKLQVQLEDVRCHELDDGKVRVDFVSRISGQPQEKNTMVFVNTAPRRWAVIEEINQLP